MRECGDCKSFKPDFEGFSEGKCTRYNKPTFSYNNYGDLCSQFKKKPVKVKPRRICPFCERHKPIFDDYGSYTLAFTKLIPLPAINLTSGEIDTTRAEPEYSLFLYVDGESGEKAAFPIKFCPVCGRKLKGATNGNTRTTGNLG